MGQKVTLLSAAITMITASIFLGQWAAFAQSSNEDGTEVVTAPPHLETEQKRISNEAYWNRKRVAMRCIEQICDHVYEMVPSRLYGSIENDPYGFGKTIYKSLFDEIKESNVKFSDVSGEKPPSSSVTYYPFDLNNDGNQDYVFSLQSSWFGKFPLSEIIIYDNKTNSYKTYSNDGESIEMYIGRKCINNSNNNHVVRIHENGKTLSLNIKEILHDGNIKKMKYYCK